MKTKTLAITCVAWMLVAILFAVAFIIETSSPAVHGQSNTVITVTTYADITGTAAAKVLSASPTTWRWCQFIALPANIGTTRWGDSSVSATQGVPLAPGAAYEPPAPTNVNNVFDLSTLYFYAAVTDKISATCGN